MTDTKEKHVLLSFSGGLDSSYLLESLVKRGIKVSTFYAELPCNINKVAAEKFARREVIEFLQTKYSVYIKDTNVRVGALVNGHDEAGQLPNHVFNQPLHWLYALAFVVDGRTHTEVNMAYVASDQFTFYFERLCKVWETLQPIIKHEPVKLMAPIWYKYKEEIINEISPEILDMIWFCEIPKVEYEDTVESISITHPIKGYTPCGDCPACKRHAMTRLWVAETSNKAEDEVIEVTDGVVTEKYEATPCVITDDEVYPVVDREDV